MESRNDIERRGMESKEGDIEEVAEEWRAWSGWRKGLDRIAELDKED